MVTIDYGNSYVITVPKSFVVFVTGKLYRLDTNAFRLELKNIEASETGIVFPDTNRHNTEVTVAGTTFARTMEILSPYSVEFEDTSPVQYAVQLVGSNNNIFDIENGILVQNPVQVIPTNSAGLIVSTNPQVGGATDWQEAEKRQIRDALGVDGDKSVAKGGQLQEKSEYPNNSTINTNNINNNDLN